MTWRAAVALLAGGSLLAAFFSGAETGAYVLSRLRLRYRAREGGAAWAKRLEGLFGDMPVFVTAMLVWTNLALDLVSFSCTSIFARLDSHAALGLRPEIAATLVAAPLLFVFAELVPKNLYRLRPEGLMAPSARALAVSVFAVRPMARVLSGAGRILRRAFGLAEPRHWALVTRRAVRSRFAESAEAGGLTLPQRELADNIMQAGVRSALSAATPLARMAAIPEDATAADLLAAAGRAATPVVLVHRRSPPGGKSPSTAGEREFAVGIAHLIQAWGVAPETPLSEIARPVVWLDGDASIIRALVTLRRAGEAVGVIAAAARDAAPAPSPENRRARAVVSVEQLVKHLVGS